MWRSKFRTLMFFFFFFYKTTQAAGRGHTNHENVNVCNTGQGEAEHRKYKSLILGGGQACDRSGV
jgi:hypothetical protein